MISIEEELLDRFFLGPGSQGPIRSVFVSDEDLLEIFQVHDIDVAKREFIRKLPHPGSLTRILAGDWSPPRQSNGHPDYVRILLFLCWMQVTRLRPRGERNFRHILDGHLGRQYVQLAGLNALWEHLADFLLSKHGIELSLPNVMPHSQIGRTLRIAFPTWRDRALLRKLRIRLDSKDFLKPLVVANRILTAGDATSVAPSFQHYFKQWNEARLAGDIDAEHSPFWRAWLAVVSEVSGNDRLELEVSEYGEVQLYSVSPDDRHTPVPDPTSVLHRVSEKLRSAIKRGHIYMEPLGFGRFRSIEQSSGRTLLVTTRAVADAAPGSILSMRPLANGWSLATFSGEVSKATPQGAPAFVGLRWSSGIHIGGSYLGRTPLTPQLEFSSLPLVEFNGSPMTLNAEEGKGRLPDGVYAGRVTAVSGSVRKSVTLIANAVEAHPDRIATLNADLETSEDGLLADTWPAGPLQLRPWDGNRAPMATEMTAICEALYARSIRKLAAGMAYEIVSRGLERNPASPPAWDVLRAFVDAGWLDMTVLRNAPAKQFVQCELAVRSLGSTLGLLVGPTPLPVLDRLERAAGASGVKLEQKLSSSPYGLPIYCLQAGGAESMAEFCRRSQLPVITGGKRRGRLAEAAEELSLEGYSCVAFFNSSSGYFDPVRTPSHDGLYRYEHSSGSSRHLYVSRRAGGKDVIISSLSVALLSHHSDAALFSYSDHLLRPRARRIRLPATWARWLALASGANPGPVNSGGTWSYAYPADPRAVRSLAETIPVTAAHGGPPKWVIHSVNSDGAERRKIFVGDALTDRRYGGVLR